MRKGTSIILIVLLTLLIGALGFFSYKLLFEKDKILVPDFTNKTKDEIVTWCDSLETNPCSFSADYSDTIPENGLIYQSIAADEELGDSIAFIISLGNKVEIKLPNIDANTTKESLEKWKTDNNIANNIEYIEQHNNDVESGHIIKVEPTILTNNTDIIKVYISKGKDENSDSADIVVTSETYLNLTVSEFEKKVKALNLVPNHNTDRDAKSSKVEKGNIVWHGSGYYVKGETINYGICLEKTEGKTITVKSKEYVGKTLEDFKKICEELGLKPEHSETYKDEYSDTIEKGCLDWHGSGEYDTSDEDSRIIHYTLSLGKKEDVEEDYKLPKYISKTDYAGKTLEEFKIIASKFGLEARHNENWDDYSDTITKGYILRNGDSTYTEDDTYISYGLSLGKKDGSSTSTYFEIKSGQFKGKTLSEFKKAVTDLGLIPEHSQQNSDDYSETVAKDCILWHGSADDFKAGEVIHYTVSLGKKGQNTPVTPQDPVQPQNKSVSISVNQYINLTESSFKSKISELGLVANHNTSKDSYSDATQGNVIWHTSGEIAEGGSVSYGLSLGVANAVVMSYNDVTSSFEESSFDDTKETLIDYFVNRCGFDVNNISFIGEASSYGKGKIISITIGGNDLTVQSTYPVNSTIVVKISNKQQ